MSNERKELLALAVTVGLVLGEDFQKNISNINLQKLIDEKKQSTADAMQDKPEEVKPPELIEESDEERLMKIGTGLGEGNPLSNYSKEDQIFFAKNFIPAFEKQIKEGETATEEEKVIYEDCIKAIGGVSVYADTSSDESNTESNPLDDGLKDEETKQENTKNEVISNDAEQEPPLETYLENEMMIKRTSKCGNYRATIIGVKEAARRSNVTVDEVKEALESGEPVNGWTFTEV